MGESERSEGLSYREPDFDDPHGEFEDWGRPAWPCELTDPVPGDANRDDRIRFGDVRVIS